MTGDGSGPSWRQIATYALPAAPLAALALPLGVLVPAAYAEREGLSLAIVGTILLAVRILDAVADPLIGHFADRGRWPGGRRRGAFLLALPLTALGSYLLFAPPADAGPWWLAIAAMLASLGYTAAMLPHSAWGAELATGYAARATIAAAREGLTLIGMLASIILPFAFADSATGLAALGLAIAVTLPLTGILAFATVPEPHDPSTRQVPLIAGLLEIGRNAAFRRLIIAFLVNGFANAVPAALFMFYVGDRLVAPEARGPLLILYFLAALPGVFFAGLAAKRFGKHRSWCVAMLAEAVIFPAALFLGEGDVAAFAWVAGLTGFLLGFDLALPPAIQADVIDSDTARTGEQRSGLFFAAWALATKLAAALAAGIALPLLSFAGYEPGMANPAPDALAALAWLYAGLPVMAKLVAVALMWHFPLDAARQAELRRMIENRQKPV